jgi:hypothetical protein
MKEEIIEILKKYSEYVADSIRDGYYIQDDKFDNITADIISVYVGSIIKTFRDPENKFTKELISHDLIIERINQMDIKEREDFASKLFDDFCHYCLSDRPCYCSRDD